ncbi:hypothetical protein KKF84_05965 [Myxococcota bacterium]|nr:hypothetical protein [Myxococcota bacterium]MBU1534845.1 hypothetical protein [Myxococcota bacterium]
MVHRQALIPAVLTCLLLLCGCVSTTRVGILSAMDKNNDLGIKGTLVAGGGLRDGKNAFLLSVKGSGGMDPVNEAPAGTVAGGIEYIRYRAKTGFRFGFFAGPTYSEKEIGTRVEVNAGIFEYFRGTMRPFGGLALDLSIGYVPGELPFSGFWYGVGLTYQYDHLFGQE